MSGKGSAPRPYSVNLDTFSNNWNAIFNKGKHMSEQKQCTCGCGRSPTGNCVGWHNLTVEQYQAKLKEKQLQESKQFLSEHN